MCDSRAFIFKSSSIWRNEGDLWGSKDSFHRYITPKKPVIRGEFFESEEASVSCRYAWSGKDSIDSTWVSLMGWNMGVICGMKSLVNIVMVVLFEEVLEAIRIYDVIEIAHYYDLFLGLKAFH